ncbi:MULTISPECIES: FMN-binding protein [unclassified Colwellia]|uniref:FMN-binding protein n=1 Tax=unclassified Colwellia TaxID=196834 RepID=UPI0028702766|nr:MULTISPECIES: FMN-binding protein [unclassified Colwellia]
MVKIIFTLLVMFSVATQVSANGTYQTSKQFVSTSFQGEVPKSKALWLSADDKLVISEIMSHEYSRLRLKYWQQASETVWVLEEIGKEKPITIGVHINNEQIVDVKVLAYRESRGDEVRHDFFTNQFKSASLTKENMLNQHIDGITGATMSVRALTKVARLALWLNKKVKV